MPTKISTVYALFDFVVGLLKTQCAGAKPLS